MSQLRTIYVSNRNHTRTLTAIGIADRYRIHACTQSGKRAASLEISAINTECIRCQGAGTGGHNHPVGISTGTVGDGSADQGSG